MDHSIGNTIVGNCLLYTVESLYSGHLGTNLKCSGWSGGLISGNEGNVNTQAIFNVLNTEVSLFEGIGTEGFHLEVIVQWNLSIKDTLGP